MHAGRFAVRSLLYTHRTSGMAQVSVGRNDTFSFVSQLVSQGKGFISLFLKPVGQRVSRVVYKNMDFM
jgi:hypothetical protein